MDTNQIDQRHDKSQTTTGDYQSSQDTLVAILATRAAARLEARLAIYGNVERTPADWTLKECFEAMRKEKAQATKQRKGKHVELIEDGAEGLETSEGENE